MRHGRLRTLRRLFALAAGMVLVASVGSAYLASNTVEPSSAGESVVSVTLGPNCPLAVASTGLALTATAETLPSGC